MKKVRSSNGSLAVDLYPLQRECPVCLKGLDESYRKRRVVVTLQGTLRLTIYTLECQTVGCRLYQTKYRPESEGAMVLPHYTFGLDVVARIGQWRYREHRTIGEITTQLRQGGVSISIKEVQLLSEVFLALVQTVITDDQQVIDHLRQQGGILLAIDGVQPEKGNETLWLLRDVRSGRVLVARNLLSSGCAEIELLIEQVKVLNIPVLGVISDKQESLCLAIDNQLPGVPHQLCHFHYLRDVAQPICEADRKLKKQLKQKVRGIRQVERKVAHQQSDEARVVRGYCVALREVMRDDGKYPLEPAGLTLYTKLHQIRLSLGNALTQRASAKLQRLRTILDIITMYTQDYARLVVAWSWIHCLAHLLNQGMTRAEAEAQFQHYATSLPSTADPLLYEIAAHIQKVSLAFAPKLFAYYDQPLLPKTNNDLELFIGQLKKDQRRITGRKNTCAFVLRQGRAVALLQSLPSEINWLQRFAAVDMKTFYNVLADLRRQDERSQAWRARRNLSAYLSLLEQDWPPPD